MKTATEALKAAKFRDNLDAQLSPDEEAEGTYADNVIIPGTKMDSKSKEFHCEESPETRRYDKNHP